MNLQHLVKMKRHQEPLRQDCYAPCPKGEPSWIVGGGAQSMVVTAVSVLVLMEML